MASKMASEADLHALDSYLPSSGYCPTNDKIINTGSIRVNISRDSNQLVPIENCYLRKYTISIYPIPWTNYTESENGFQLIIRNINTGDEKLLCDTTQASMDGMNELEITKTVHDWKYFRDVLNTSTSSLEIYIYWIAGPGGITRTFDNRTFNIIKNAINFIANNEDDISNNKNPNLLGLVYFDAVNETGLDFKDYNLTIYSGDDLIMKEFYFTDEKVVPNCTKDPAVKYIKPKGSFREGRGNMTHLVAYGPKDEPIQDGGSTYYNYGLKVNGVPAEQWDGAGKFLEGDDCVTLTFVKHPPRVVLTDTNFDIRRIEFRYDNWWVPQPEDSIRIKSVYIPELNETYEFNTAGMKYSEIRTDWYYGNDSTVCKVNQDFLGKTYDVIIKAELDDTNYDMGWSAIVATFSINGREFKKYGVEPALQLKGTVTLSNEMVIDYIKLEWYA